MKTSTILLLLFLTILFFVITTSFFSMNRRFNPTNFSEKETVLPSFSVLVAESKSSFLIQNGSKNKIIQSFRRETLPNFAPFVVRNDTLFISSVNQKLLNQKDYWIIPKVYCIQLKSIVVKKDADVRIDKFKSTSLQIMMNNSSLKAWKSNFKSLALKADGSYVKIEGFQIENLKFDIQKTTLDFDVIKKMNSLSGSLKDNSKGNFSNSSTNVNISSDKSSNYHIYN